MPATPEDLQNMTGWLQQILAETQTARAASQEVLAKLNTMPQNNGQIAVAGGESERKIDDMRNYFDGRLNKLEANQNDFRNLLNDIRAKVDKLG